MEEIRARIKQLQSELDDPEILNKIRIEAKLEAYNECLGYLEAKSNFNDTYTVGVGHLDHKVDIEVLQRFVRENKTMVIISGHNLPSAETLSKMVQGVKEKHPEYFDMDELFATPVALIPFRAPLEIPELNFSKKDKQKGHEPPFKYHR